MQKPLQVQEYQTVAVEADDGDEIDLLEVARTLWRGKLWILLCTFLVLAAGWYRGVVTKTPTYSATTEMALLVDAQPALDIQAVVTGLSGDTASLNTELAVITSGEMISRLVDALRLDQDPEFNGYLADPNAQPGLLDRARGAVEPFLPVVPEEVAPLPSAERQRQETIDEVREAISTSSNRDSYVFRISATTEDPQKSMLLANTLAELFREDQIRGKVEATERMAVWLSDRVGELRAELDTRQNEIAELRARSSLVSDESLQALNEQAVELRSALREAETQLARADSRLATLQAADAETDIEAIVQASEDSQLAAAAASLAAGDAGAQLRFDRRLNQVLLQAQAERDRAQEQVAELREATTELSTQFESQSADYQALQQLEQEAEATQVLYETFLMRLREASVQESAHQPDSRILTAATDAEQVAPRPARVLALSGLLGLLLGAGLVLGREFLQNTFRTAEDLERHTGRPVLGQIPKIPARTRADTIRYLQNKPTSAAAEAVRNLRTSLLLSDVDRPPRVIMATSSIPAEGKTTVAIALAQNLAGLEKRVLLIEGDIRRRTFKAYFGQSKQAAGLLSVVSGQVPLKEAVVRPSGGAIDVLLGEKSSINAADLFSSESFRRLVDDARETYDYVVIDTPPVLVVPDARVIAQHVDAAVYVVHWDHTSKNQVEEGLRLFRSISVPVAGLVLSRVDPRGMRRYGYGGRYGPYSRYARGYYGA